VRSRFTKGYAKLLARQPGHVKKRATKSVELLESNPRYPGLHFKEVSRKESAWSIRLSKDYRMVGYRDADTVSWFWIGTHGAYDKLLQRLKR